MNEWMNIIIWSLQSLKSQTNRALVLLFQIITWFFCTFSSFSIFCAVPRCETLSRLQDNESFPLLGKQGRTLTRAGWLLLLPGPRPGFFFPFRLRATSPVAAGEQFLVKYGVSGSCKEFGLDSLCLLCNRRLARQELPAHVFSREHVLTFLVSFVLIPAVFSTGLLLLLRLRATVGCLFQRDRPPLLIVWASAQN